jgi:hypothetical protein
VLKNKLRHLFTRLQRVTGNGPLVSKLALEKTWIYIDEERKPDGMVVGWCLEVMRKTKDLRKSGWKRTTQKRKEKQKTAARQHK